MSEQNLKSATSPPIGENSEASSNNAELREIDKSEDISVFDLETFQKQLSRLDGKKQKTTIMLTNSEDVAGPSCERDIVGDDLNKKEQNIHCECEPNVTGAAVPAVCSFNEPRSENLTEIAQTDDVVAIPEAAEETEITPESEDVRECENFQQLESSKYPKTDRPKKCATPSNSRSTNRTAVNPLTGGNVKQKLQADSRISQKRVTAHHQDTQVKRNLSNAKKESLTADRKPLSKRPSMIPKLSRPSTSSTRKDSSERISTPNGGTYRSKLPTAIASSNSLANEANNISVKMCDLKQRLKLTTNMLRRKINSNSKIDGEVDLEKYSSPYNAISGQYQYPSIRTETTGVELQELINRLEEFASNMETAKALNKQKYIHQLKTKVDDIKDISKYLVKEQNEKSGISNENIEKEISRNNLSKQTKSKDNKIHIKFMQSKEKSERKLKNNVEKMANQESICSNSVMESQQCNPISEDQVKSENSIRETDSMDGVFIPTCEPPKNMEDEEEETNGLDITITFPDFNPMLPNQDDSHLSVKLSDISEEALRKLKRCPKDFTLRMDFVQGKVVFQSGKAPVNNFSIGPDLKFIENPVTDHKSNLIDIKPSTECRFTSQVISVENMKERPSFKSLKSTDSELFNVVKLPFIYKYPSMSTVTKSCVTFQNENFLSMAIIARQVFKSMPQIASLSNFFEDGLVRINRSVLHNTEKKRKFRPNPKKAITSSTVL